jgi:hypothetical protein
MKDVFPMPEGSLYIRYRDKDGKLIKEDYVKNLILNNAKLIMRDQLYSGLASNSLNTLQVGNMNLSYGVDTTTLTPPAVTDIALVNPIYNTPASTKVESTVGGKLALSLDFTIPIDGANSANPANFFNLITELGLYTVNNRIFSRVVTPIIKSRDTSLDVLWNILI